MTRRVAVAMACVAAAGAAWGQENATQTRRHPRATLPVLPRDAVASTLGLGRADGSIPDPLHLPGWYLPDGTLDAALAEAIFSLTGAIVTKDEDGGLTLQSSRARLDAADALLAAVRTAAARTWRVDIRVLAAPDAPEALATVELDVVEGGGAAAAQVTARPFVRAYGAEVAEDAVAPQPQRGVVTTGLAVDVACRPHPVDLDEAVFRLRLAWAALEPDGALIATRAGEITPVAVRVTQVETAVRLRAGERCVAGATSAEVPGVHFEVTARPAVPAAPAGPFTVFPIAAILDPPRHATAPELSTTARWEYLDDGGFTKFHGSRDDAPDLPEWPATAVVGPWLVADSARADLAAIRSEFSARIDAALRDLKSARLAARRLERTEGRTREIWAALRKKRN